MQLLYEAYVTALLQADLFLLLYSRNRSVQPSRVRTERKYTEILEYIYVWIYENRAHLSTTTLKVFQEITGDFSIDQPQAA